jgi:hypothetical protein
MIVKVVAAPYSYQISPVKVLASMVQILCNPEKVPIAVAVSFIWEHV